MIATPSPAALVDALDALLPQTQCQRCGYDDCRHYAQALAHGQAAINRCPPGGEATRQALARQLQRPQELEQLPPLADDVEPYAAEHVARIDEAHCIGCAKCLPVCPTDAIIGASRRMHTVLPEHCTGCELCIIACPVDCIDLVAQTTAANRQYPDLDSRAAQSQHLRRAYQAHQQRQQLAADARLLRRARPQSTPSDDAPPAPAAPDKKALLADILARARARA